jgi:hypothetical protein
MDFEDRVVFFGHINMRMGILERDGYSCFSPARAYAMGCNPLESIFGSRAPDRSFVYPSFPFRWPFEPAF